MDSKEQTIPAAAQQAESAAQPPPQPPAADQSNTQDSQHDPETQSTADSAFAIAPSDQTLQGDGAMYSNSNGNFPLFGQTIDNHIAFEMTSMMPTTDPTISGLNGVNIPQSVNTNGHAMSADDIALYDRQIRLWGVQAQQKIQGANILLITMKALATEVAKNLVLAGIGSLTIVDDQQVTETDLGAQFFVSHENIGQNRAKAAAVELQKLNPRVKVIPDDGSIMTKGASYFAGYNIVIATDLNPTLLAFINTATRLHNRQFYAAGSQGMYGYIFSDLIEHDYVLKRDKANVATTIGPESRTRSVTEVKEQKEGGKMIELVSKRELYSTWDLASETSLLPAEYLKSKRRLKAVTPALSCLRTLWGFQQIHNRDPAKNKQDLEFFTRAATNNHQLLSLPTETLRSDFLRSFLQNIGSEIAPVAAILGGQLAQDVINVLGQNQPPIQNMVIFDGDKMEANMYSLHPEGNLGRAQLELPNPMPMAQPMNQPMDQTMERPMGQPMGQVDQSQMFPMDQSQNTMPGTTM
ncbi:hypothetical protein F5Y15DRAFT_409107 [Xylariaceae sp. FL0016]|nr:hypothetical protein F5Y15DRAFT_409107 [Xylariaceae sp. FL0016]